MDILVFTGSHRPRSNSGYLAASFAKGAQEAGHKVEYFATADKKIRACIGCGACRMENPCIFNDDFSEIRDRLISADMVVFATPTYYFGMSSQIKSAIDRFFSADNLIHGKKKSALIAVCGDEKASVMDGLVRQYELIVDYLDWKDAGRVLAAGLDGQGAVVGTPFVQNAYDLGKNC